jgi:hypothetical protein
MGNLLMNVTQINRTYDYRNKFLTLISRFGVAGVESGVHWARCCQLQGDRKMYTDTVQTKQQYVEHLKHTAQEYRDAQYDAALLEQWLGRTSRWLGERLVVWGQRHQVEPPVTNSLRHLC